MSGYCYEEQREALFTDAGQRAFLRCRDRVKLLLTQSGAVRLGEAARGSSADSWTQIAMLDRMVELGELREIPQSPDVMTQDRIFVAAR